MSSSISSNGQKDFKEIKIERPSPIKTPNDSAPGSESLIIEEQSDDETSPFYSWPGLKKIKIIK